jgi:hypothetical protein
MTTAVFVACDAAGSLNGFRLQSHPADPLPARLALALQLNHSITGYARVIAITTARIPSNRS